MLLNPNRAVRKVDFLLFSSWTCHLYNTPVSASCGTGTIRMPCKRSSGPFWKWKQLLCPCRTGRWLYGKSTWKNGFLLSLLQTEVIIVKIYIAFYNFQSIFLNIISSDLQSFLFFVTCANWLSSQKFKSLICKKGTMPCTLQNCEDKNKGVYKVYSTMPEGSVNASAQHSARPAFTISSLSSEGPHPGPEPKPSDCPMVQGRKRKGKVSFAPAVCKCSVSFPCRTALN